jgi:hypothetical protein
LSMKVAECPDPVDVDFLVVESLVVPALLGTPWIDSYVWSIDPPKRTVLLRFAENKEPFRVALTTAPKRLQHPLRVSSEQTLPPLSETWVDCHSTATGLSLIRPSRRRDRLVQAKNGVKNLPDARETFLCLVANFDKMPKTLAQGQVVGEVEAVSLWPEGKIEKEIRKTMTGSDK